uniref:Rho guanine nucleotide exchange factor (GEF) 38 n=1 Tax=Xiphophorus couchianus TaxID=32473 RepID=A0A3B5LSK2_9TELE
MPLDLSALPSPVLDVEEIWSRKMSRRAKVIKELVQTEKDYLTDLELCIREVVQPLRVLQVVDVDRLFTNMETVCEVSAALLNRLHVAMSDPDPEAVFFFLFVLGEVFIQAKAALEDVYKIYCYHHDDANMSLKAYEKEEQIKQGKPNLLDMGSLLIKPVQRIMKYPLLLGELWQATPEDHIDYLPLQEALTASKIINVNINEFRRRKDIVMKYKRLENDEGTLRGKLNKINIHSLRKKGDRFAGYLKILTGVEPQVTTRRSSFTLCRRRNRSVIGLNNRHQYPHAIPQRLRKDGNICLVSSCIQTAPSEFSNLCKSTILPSLLFQKERMEELVLLPLTSLQGMFTAPQKLIQKRYDKLLDYCCRLERSSSFASSSSTSTRDYEAINALLVDELQRFNMAAYTILTNCVLCLVALLRGLMVCALVGAPAVHQLPVRITHTHPATQQIPTANIYTNTSLYCSVFQVQEVQHQTEEQRAWLLAEYPPNRLYQLKRKCNGCQEQDLSLLEGELVALLEDTDPLGSSSRWLVHNGGKCVCVCSSSTFWCYDLTISLTLTPHSTERSPAVPAVRLGLLEMILALHQFVFALCISFAFDCFSEFLSNSHYDQMPQAFNAVYSKARHY